MREGEGKESGPGGIFKHDVAITSDQSGIFHPAPFIRRKRERRACATSPSLRCLHPFPLRTLSPPPPSYGLLTGNLPRLLLTVLSLYSPSLRWRNVFPSFSYPFPSSARIQAVSPLPRRVAFPLVLPAIDPSRPPPSFPPRSPSPQRFKSGSKFVKTVRAASRFRSLGIPSSAEHFSPYLFEDTFSVPPSLAVWTGRHTS